MNWAVLLSTYVILLVSDVSSLYSTMDLWSQRCFIEDVPDNSMITYTWELNDYIDAEESYETTPSRTKKMLISIRAGDGAVHLQKDSKEGKGKISYFASDYGEYNFCFELIPASDDYTSTNAKLHIQSERQYQDEEGDVESAEEDTKNSIKIMLQRGIRKVQQIRSEQKYYRERELEFRSVSYLTSVRVLWFGGVTALTVVSTGCYMMYNLKNFFISKKLV